MSMKKKRNFGDWLQRFENWLALQNALLPDTQKFLVQVKCQSLVQHLGADGRNRLSNVFAGKIPVQLDTDYRSLRDILKSVFAEALNLRITRHCFFARKQGPSETITEFANALQMLAEHCNFGTIQDDLLTSQLYRGCYKENVQLKLLQENMLDFDKLVELALSVESASCIGSSSVSLSSVSKRGVPVAVQTEPNSCLLV